jgi:hypothetical protein
MPNIILTDAFVSIFASTLVEGMLMVLKSNSPAKEKEMLIDRLLVFYFHGLVERLS